MPSGHTANLDGTHRILRGVGFVLIAAAAAVGYWLISPVFRDVFLDEPLPEVKDAFALMDEGTRVVFEREVELMRDVVSERNEAMPLKPHIVRRGTLVPRVHEVMGEVLVVDTGPMQYIRFETLATINGPDLRIYLASDLSDDDIIDLGPIRATQGNVNYGAPPGTDFEHYRYVMIWCRAFSVLFSYAELE